MTTQEAKKIRIADYLQSLGYSPVKRQGKSLWYKYHRLGAGTLPLRQCAVPVGTD